MRRLIGRALDEAGQLLAGGGVGVAAVVLAYLTLLAVPATLLLGLGIPWFAAAVAATRWLAGPARRRAAAVLGTPVPTPYRPHPRGPLGRVRALLRDPATWRDLAWLPCQAAAGIGSAVVGVALWLAVLQCLTAPALNALLPARASYSPVALELVGRSGPLTWLLVPVGAPLAAAAYLLPRRLIAGQARLAAWLLAPTSAARLSARVEDLTASRAAAVDASATELRRVERDLHDGAQVRLVALTMSLGMAEDVLDDDPAGARALMAEARANATAALSELRDLVRGIHPPVLADRGLAGAVRALAMSDAVPVEVDVRLERRLSAPVESAAYFAVAELLANAVRHSGAEHISVGVVDTGPTLRVTVRDDGRGGADPSGGTGLRGIARRLSSFDGTLTIVSPAGGPTTVDIELPCAS